MSRITPLVLLVVVGLLGYLALRQHEAEENAPVDAAAPLFPGVEPARLAGLRIENLEGSRHFRFEADNAALWFVVDPLRWPAEATQIQKVLEIVARNQAQPVPEALQAEALATLTPPRGFIETRERIPGGEDRLVRVEIGGPDIDGYRMFVRRGGELFRTPRNVEYPLQLDLHDLRSKRLFSLGGGVQALERIGGWPDASGLVPLTLRADASSGVWRITQPVQVPADPNLIAAWLAYLGGMTAKSFASDIDDPDLSRYGLDPPLLTVEVTNPGGAKSVLHIGEEAGLYAQRGGLSTVYRLDSSALSYVTEATSHFFDHQIARFERRQVRHLYLRRATEDLRFTPSREEDGQWTLAVAERSSGVFGPERRADRVAVEDLLSALDSTEIVEYLTEGSVEENFGGGTAGASPEAAMDGAPIHTAFEIVVYRGLNQGARFAPSKIDVDGTELGVMHRPGDSIATAVDPQFIDLLERPTVEFLDRYLWSVTNAWQRRLEITGSGGAASRTYERADEFDWRPAGIDVPARELDPVLDHLLFLRAERHVPEADEVPLDRVIRVVFTDVRGTRNEVAIGLDPAGQTRLDADGLQSIAARQELHADLSKLLD